MTFQAPTTTLWATLFILTVWFAGCEAGPTSRTEPGSIGGTISGLDAGTEVVLRSFDNGNLVNVATTTSILLADLC